MGFILIALLCGAEESVYGRLICAGLMACAVGDVLLLNRASPKMFQLGMLAFLLGHVFYGFAALGVTTKTPPDDPFKTELNALALLIVTFVLIGAYQFWRYLRPRLGTGMKPPVFAYMFVIAFMVTAFWLKASTGFWLAPLAALMFAVSDIFVAKDRFVKAEAQNALFISPLYFGAQALFAISVGAGL